MKATGSVFDYHKYASVFKVPNVAYLFFLKIVSALPLGIFQAMFSIFAMDYFHLNAKQNGMVLSYVGIMGMVSSSLFSLVYTTVKFLDSLKFHRGIIFPGCLLYIQFMLFLTIFTWNYYPWLLPNLHLMLVYTLFIWQYYSQVSSFISY